MDWNVSIVNKLNEINNKITLINIERRNQNINSIVLHFENSIGQKEYHFSGLDKVVISAKNINNSNEPVEISLNANIILRTENQFLLSVSQTILNLNDLVINAVNCYNAEIIINGAEILLK
jgi:hypothetical protein